MVSIVFMENRAAFIINILFWGCLIGLAVVITDLQRLYMQAYDIQHFLAYVLMVVTAWVPWWVCI